MKNKRSRIFLIGSILWLIISILTAFLSTFFVKNVNNEVAEIDPEIKMSMQYTQITNDDEFEKVDGTEYVKFGVYFTRDLDGDGNAEKMLGSCRNLNEKDVLFMNLNVLSNGYLKNGKITINSSNFKYNMNMVKDSVLKYNYIKDDVKEIELKDVQNGTQKLILGDVVSNIGNNINNYSNKTYVTLTGTHVADDSKHTETQISKTIEIIVDWHGETQASLYTNTYYYNYDTLNTKTISFEVTTNETKQELLLKDNVTTFTIPELNGFAPEEVKCTNSGVNYVYDENTRILTITKESTVAENGTVTSSMPRSNSYTVAVTYPEEAYNSITTYTTLNVPVSTYYDGYNNNSEQSEFANPYKSNVAEGNVTLIFRETPPPSQPTGYIYNFYVNIMDKNYVSKPFYRYVISKQDILNLYDSDDEIKNKEYTIQWQAVRGALGEVSSMIMSEPKAESYGDTWQNSVENKIMEEYTVNTGIYFSGADGMFGKDGTISIYNNDTNELIKTFTKNEWQNISKENPFKYEEPVKHIRVETSTANVNSSLSVYNIKELDVAKVLQDFTKEELKEIDKVHTYLKGTCNIQNGSSENVTREDYAYFISEKSYARLELETRKMSTQETLENEKIYIDAKTTQTGDAKWKDGIFIVEIPEEIINTEINSIETNNQNVKIVAYDLYKQNGKYLLKILTENSSPEVFRITVNSNLTSDPTVKTKSVEFKLYAYNKYCNDYYYEIQDIYDIDGDNITDEKIGTAQNEGYTTMQLISPTNLVTLETVTDYDDEEEGKETIAPNVAIVDNTKKEATINIKATNNYPYEVCDVKIIGKIPFTGNTYIINGKDMHSEFDASLNESGINLPEELVNKATIYYSEKENPSFDLEDLENGWTTTISDYSKIKSYLIDLNDYEMPKGKELSFSYKLNLPDDVSLNQVTFSNHAIYFSLKTDGGKLSLATEPNKVGVRIVKKFELDLTKYKKNSNLTIPGVTYLLKYDEKDIDDPSKINETTRILTTNSNGKINLNNLYAEKTYKLKEIGVPDTCELNDEEIEFTVNSDNTITMQSQGNTSLKNVITYTNDIVKVDLEDEVKFDLEINKTKIGSNIKINNVRFKIQDENGNKKFANTVNGLAKIEGLSLNKTYTLQESSTPGNVAKNEGSLVFKLVRNNEGNITIQTISNTLASSLPSLEDLENNLTPVVKLNVENEIRYSLNLTKQDKSDGSKLQGVKFKITGKGFGTNGTTIKTSNEGKIEVSGLYVGEEYSLEEIEAEGYYLDSTKDNSIKFKVERNGSLQITKWQKGEGIDEVGERAFTESMQDLNAELSVILQNEKIPTYSLNLVKENEEGTKLKGAQFKLTIIDTGKSYTLTTDEQGKASFDGLYEYISSKSFVTGKYTLEEIYAPVGYAVDKTKLEFNAIRNNEGKVEIQITSGDSIIKEIDGTKQITSDENGVTIAILNKPVFSLKKTGDEGILLPNAKFIITDLNGNLALGTDGKIIGAPDGVLETNEKGEISASLPQGLYKAVEVEAPEGYDLPENEEDRTFYFGIGESQPQETEFTLSWNKTVSATGPVRIKDVIKDNDGNFVAVGSVYEDANIAENAITSKGDFDGVIVKFNQDGNIIWYKTVAGDGDDQLLTIAKDPTGGYVVAGFTSSSNLYYTNGTDSIASASFGMEDAIFIKINNDGTFSHCKVIGGVGTDKINGIAVNNQGDIAVVGSYLSSDMHLNGDKTDSSSTITHSRKNGTENSPTDKKNAFISVYTNEGEYIWSQNIAGIAQSGSLSSSTTANEAWASNVSATNSGFVVTANINGNVYLDTAKLTSVSSTGNADGIVINYTNNGNTIKYQKIAGSNNDELYDVIQDKDGNIVVVGSFSSNITLGSKTLYSKGEFDMIVAKYNQNLDYIDSISFGGTLDDSIKSISETEDGGYLLGGLNYSSAMDFDGDGTNDITSNSGKSDGLILKLGNDLQLQSYEGIKGSGYEEINGVLETDDGGIITVGDFDSSSLSTATSNVKNFVSNTGYFDGLIAKFGQVVTAPEVATAQKIEVQNNLKEFKITTEIGINSDKERVGGTVTGDVIEGEENKKFVETIKYGYSNANSIEIIPSDNYQVVKITVNDEEIPFVADEQRKVTIPAEYFKDVMENKHIVVTFEKDVKSLLVHHYLKNEDGTYTEIKVAEDETVSGKIGAEYTTKPKMDLEDYELEKDAEGEYVIPQNASGTFSDSNEDVTYYYEARKYTLEVNHYLDGTENKLTESQVTKHIKGYEYETSKSNDVLQDYNFVYVDGEEQGTLTEDTVVNYFYQKKEYTITTEVAPNSETNILGGTITGEYNNIYTEENGIRYVETVKKNEASTETIEIIPDFGYKVKTITLESTDENENKISKVIYGENKDENTEVQAVEDEDGKITLTKFNSVTENKHIKVEFETLENSIIVHHYLKEKNDLTTKKVAEDEIIKIISGQENSIKPKDNLNKLRLAKNSDGTDMLPKAEVNSETGIIEVSYYYEPDEIILTLSHYLADTNEKIVEDEIIKVTPEIVEQDENGYYTIVKKDFSYKLEDNENYKNIINDKYLTSIAGDYNKNYEIGEKFAYTFNYSSNSEIKYIYKAKGNYDFIINYYYDGVKDETKTENKTVRTGDTINDYTDNKITGYKLEKAKVVNKENEEIDLPYLVKDDLSRIVLNVYYIKDSFNYTIKYFYDGVEDISKQRKLKAEYGSTISNYPEANKEGYLLQSAKTLNANSEEIDLPLTITENESKNIINVYYVKTKTFKFYKTWSNIQEADVNNYRSTFKLKKTINGVTSDCTDVNGNNVTKTITGNGNAVFENIATSEGTNKIEYSVEEIKVEKTLDGGSTWKELPLEDYKSVNNKTEILADKVKVGDYINYNSASGSGSGLTFKSSQAKTGTNITGTFNSSDLNTWRVLSIDDDKIKIIPAQPTSQKVTLDGAYGYINSEAMLNEISSIYGQGKGAISARSITAEDLEEYFKFNKNEFENSNSSTGYYGGTKEYTSGSFVVNNQVISGPQTIEQGSYYYEARSYNYSGEENVDANMVYNMLFKNIDTTANPFWLATKGADLQENNCRFDVLNISNGYVGRTHLYTSNGSGGNSSLRVMPVVTLDGEMNGEQDENGVWQFIQGKKGYTVENTLTPNYRIKKEWKLKNPNNYKATFKLMKTVDGVTSEATDDSGSIITKTITGNGTATFTDLKPYENEKAVTYSAVETKVEKTEDDWATSNEVDMDLFIITHKEEAGFNDVFVNSANNKFSLDINITEDTENLPLDGIEFTISIKDEENNNILTENKTYTSGLDGNLIEIANELPINSENKTFTVTITQNTSKEGYKKIQTPVTFTVTSKLADNGISYVLVPENKTVTNTKGVEVEENSILVKLQNSYIAEYEVHYFYDGVENEESKLSYQTTVGATVESYESKPQGMVLEKAKALNAEGEEVNLPLTVRKDKANNIINVYYRTEYKITTKVNKHDEVYTNKTETNVAGGTISGSDQSSYENVFKGDASTKQIKITPNAGYAISSVKVNGVEKLGDLTEKINATDGSLTLAVTGGTNIAGGYFTDVLENKEVEVEFRKKTKITVKYLEKDSKAVLAEEKIIEGLEGDTFGKTDEKHIIARVAVNNYKETTVTAVKHQGGNVETEISGEIVDGIIKEAFAEIKEDETGKKYAKGTMFADEITLIYWYEKIPTGVWVRHVEIDEVGKINGEKTELKPVEKLTFTDNTKEVLREEFEGYVPVNCPNNMVPLVNGTVQDGNVVASASENAKTVTYSAGETVEVWFFYEQEHKITTEVVPHKETIEGIQKDVEGGTISKNYKLDEHGDVTDEEEEFFEKVLHRGNSSKKIEIVPQDGYRIKQILIDEENQDLASLVKEDETATLDAGAIQDIKKDISVKVEFEKIPAKVIVKYIDVETDEDIVNPKEVNGYVGDTYNEPRTLIEGYKEAGEEPANASGTMKKDPTTVTYYYQRLRKIKTEVKLHEETKNDQTVMAKGGAVSGDGLNVYEYVEKGNSSTKEIVITPENGYTIKSVKINDVEQEITVNEDGTYKLAQFTNVTEDIHVVVEFAQIPAKVKVLYLETVEQNGEDVEKEIAEQDLKNVFINDEYKTEPKLVEFYKLIETKMPENQNGVVTEDEITVKYYYEKLPFNLKVVKEISKIMLNGELQEVADSSNAKVEINYRKINDIKLEISYRIRVTNTEKVAGKAILEEIVPNGFDLVLDENGKMWTKQTELSDIAKIVNGTQYALETGEIKPGETKEYVVTLKWNPNILNRGTKSNVAQLAEIKNAANYRETNLNDNISDAKVEIILNYQSESGENNNNENNNSGSENNTENNNGDTSETGEANNQENDGTNNSSSKEQDTNVKEASKVPQTGQTRAIYAALGMIIVMSAAGIIAITIKIRKDN